MYLIYLDMIYWQAYPHNPYGIVSGFFKWSSYMGDVNNRGMAYCEPNLDAYIRFEPFTHKFTVANVHDRNQQWSFKPIDLMRHELAIMGHRNRVADGNGVSVVIPYRSCIMDRYSFWLTRQ